MVDITAGNYIGYSLKCRYYTSDILRINENIDNIISFFDTYGHSLQFPKIEEIDILSEKFELPYLLRKNDFNIFFYEIEGDLMWRFSGESIHEKKQIFDSAIENPEKLYVAVSSSTYAEIEFVEREIRGYANISSSNIPGNVLFGKKSLVKALDERLYEK